MPSGVMRFIQASKSLSVDAGNLQIARQVVEDAGDIGRALNIGVTAQRVHASARASHIAEQQLQHRGQCG